MVFIIITGNIDLSVASNLGMSASFMGWLFMAGINIWVAALAALVLGSLGGLFNGLLVAKVNCLLWWSRSVLTPFIAASRTFCLVIRRHAAIRKHSRTSARGSCPARSIPFSVGLFAVLAMIFGLVLHKTTFGRYLYAIGNNENACRLFWRPGRRASR